MPLTSDTTPTDGGGYLIMGSGSSGFVVSGGQTFVVSGFTAQSGIVESGGVVSAISGGVLETTSVLGGGKVVIAAGGSASGDTVVAGGDLAVVSGGLAEGITVSNATFEVDSGGIGSANTAGSGCIIQAMQGEVAADIILSGGVEVATETGGNALSATVSNGGAIEATLSGIVNAALVLSGARALAFREGVIEQTSVFGVLSTYFLHASSFDNTIESGGSAVVRSGGVSLSDTVLSGGSETVFNSGIASALTNDGALIVASGGLAEGVTDVGGGSETVLSGGEIVVTNVATVSSLVVSAGGLVEVPIAFSSGATASYNAALHELIVSAGGAVTSVQFAASQPDIQPFGVTSATDGETLVTLACFACGTRIATPGGSVAVESLRAGDLVSTVLGHGARPVRWIGRRSLATPALASPGLAWPIEISAGAFGDGSPARRLRLSPEHAVHVDGVLVPARHLVNATSIRQVAVDEIDYFHIELDAHDVLLAEGVPAESWRDTGNVGMFANAATHPPRTAGAPCAQLVEGGARLAAIRARLDARAAELGFPLPPLVFVTLAAGRQIVTVPPGVGEIRLASPAGYVAGDRRRLGAAISGLALDGRPLPLDDRALVRGWHAREAGFRWTDGEAAIVVMPRGESRALTVEVAALAA